MSKREVRLDHSKGHVEAFFDGVQARLEDSALLPTNRLTTALGYAYNRRHALSLHLHDPEVAVDTNHLERTLRPVPLGRKNWLFAWTELGARQIGIAQMPDHHLPVARHQALRVPDRCAAASGPTPRLTR